MNTLYRILSLKDSEEWNKYLNMLPYAQQDIYFSPQYYFLYESYGDGEAICFVYQQGNKIALYPFLKNSINKLGYRLDTEYFDIQGAYGYNGVITNCEETEFKDGFYQAFNAFCQKENIVAEFTRSHPLLQNHKFSKEYMTVLYNRKTVFLNLQQTEKEIWEKSYSSSNRNKIRKALKNNVEIIVSKQQDDYLSFYNIYVETMQDVNSDRYLFFNQQYFIDFLKQMPNNHKLILAKLNGEIIGGMILMFYNNYAHYHLSARKKEYGKYATNNLFLDYAIKESKTQGCKFFHFGGGTTSDEKDSLLKFKSNFSKDKSSFYIGKKVHNKEVYSAIIKQWKEKFTKSYSKNNQVILGYRILE